MVGVDNRVRGLRSGQETHQANTYRDARSVVTRLIEQLHQPSVMAIAIVMIAGTGFMVPSIGDLLLVAALFLTGWGLTREEDLPLKVPVQAGFRDPKTGKPGAGIFFLGNEMDTGKQIWLTNDDCRQHMLVLGTTGAGKTETLLGFVANALTWNSGFLFCDGKGDVQLFAKVYALARRFGREDDLLVLNFMTGNRDVSKLGGKLLSNTLNPFSAGSSASLTQMVVSLMDDAGGDGAMWKGRAEAMFTGVMRALVWLRDEQVVDLNVGVIRDYLNLRAIIDLSDPKKYPDMPAKIRHSVRSYLSSLPGFVEEKGYKQAQTTLDQHGYLEMQFTRIFGSLADVYGHIFFTPSGEVDMYDVVLNRRLLVIMLPALEMSGDGIANLGKIVVANLKGMMGASLGSVIEGSWADVVEKRQTTSPSPFIVCLDEVGYYTVDGMALMAAQARSLGFSLIFASQDIPAMKRLNEKEAASIAGNTNTKVIMRTEEMEQTMNLAVQSAGKGLQTRVGGFDGRTGEISTQYADNFQASLTEVDRINARDIRAQHAGDMTIIHQDHVVRAKAFYANPEGALEKHALDIGTNHFIKVPKPSLSEINEAERLPEILEHLIDPDFARRMSEESRAAIAALPRAAARNEEIALAVTGFEAYVSSNRGAPLSQAACAAIANMVRAMGGLGNAFARQLEERRAAAGAPEIDDEPPTRSVSRESLDDDFMPSPADRAASPIDLLGELIDDEPPVDEFHPADTMEALSDTRGDDLAALDEFSQPPRSPAPARRPSTIVNVEHGVEVGGRGVDDLSSAVAGNDSVMRLLADLDYNSDNTTAEEIEGKLEEDFGVRADLDWENVATSEEIDAVAAASERVRAPQEPLGSESSRGYISEFLDALLEEEAGEGGN